MRKINAEFDKFVQEMKHSAETGKIKVETDLTMFDLVTQYALTEFRRRTGKHGATMNDIFNEMVRLRIDDYDKKQVVIPANRRVD